MLGSEGSQVVNEGKTAGKFHMGARKLRGSTAEAKCSDQGRAVAADSGVETWPTPLTVV